MNKIWSYTNDRSVIGNGINSSGAEERFSNLRRFENRYNPLQKWHNQMEIIKIKYSIASCNFT